MAFEKNYLIVSIIFLLVIGYFVYSMYQDIIVLKNEMKSILQEETESEEYESILQEEEYEYQDENELMDEFENCFHGVKLETIQEEPEPDFTEISEITETDPLILEEIPMVKEKKARKPRKAKETSIETPLEL